MSDIRESGEDYLEAVLVLARERSAVRAVDIACYLEVSKASVSKALARLTSLGYVEVAGHDVRLTPEGCSLAENIRKRHEFFRALLIRSGVESAQADAEACRLEHCLSEESFRRLSHLLSPVMNARRA